MLSVQILAHAVVVLFSLAGMISLFSFSKKLVGDTFSNVIELIVWGIFFSVFIHSVVELLEATGTLSGEMVSVLMNILLAVGSVCFAFAGRAGLKIVKGL